MIQLTSHSGNRQELKGGQEVDHGRVSDGEQNVLDAQIIVFPRYQQHLRDRKDELLPGDREGGGGGTGKQTHTTQRSEASRRTCWNIV